MHKEMRQPVLDVCYVVGFVSFQVSHEEVIACSCQFESDNSFVPKACYGGREHSKQRQGEKKLRNYPISISNN